MRGVSKLREALRPRGPRSVGRPLWTHRLYYVGTMRAYISQDTQKGELLIGKSKAKPREARWSTTEVVDSRVTSRGVHSKNLSLHEELVGTEFMR